MNQFEFNISVFFYKKLYFFTKRRESSSKDTQNEIQNISSLFIFNFLLEFS